MQPHNDWWSAGTKASCDHEWEYDRAHHDPQVGDVRRCLKCGHTETYQRQVTFGHPGWIGVWR